MATSKISTMPKCGHRTLTAASNLANLLPTGTVLTFQALLPSFSNNGHCHPANRLLTLSAIVICSVVCFLSSFTDSFSAPDNKLYYGIATTNGLWIFNDDPTDDYDPEVDIRNTLKKRYSLCPIDFVHAFSSLLVFLVFATGSSDVQSCLFHKAGANVEALIINLPLAAATFAGFIFTLFPTKRRGIGA